MDTLKQECNEACLHCFVSQQMISFLNNHPEYQDHPERVMSDVTMILAELISGVFKIPHEQLEAVAAFQHALSHYVESMGDPRNSP